MKDGVKVIVTNRKARHDFAIVETFEAGIALMGTEVKSLREGKANLRDSFASMGASHSACCSSFSKMARETSGH